MGPFDSNVCTASEPAAKHAYARTGAGPEGDGDVGVTRTAVPRAYFVRFVELLDFFSLGDKFVRGGRGCFWAMWVDRLFVAT